MPGDISKLLAHASDNCNVDSIMTPSVVSVEMNTTFPEIAGKMHEQHIHRVFVTENGKILGVIQLLIFWKQSPKCDPLAQSVTAAGQKA